MRNVNQRRKYAKIKWAPNGVIGTAAHQAVDKLNEAIGCTLKTGGEIDFVVANYETKAEKSKVKWKRVLRKSQSSQVKQVPATSSGKENG